MEIKVTSEPQQTAPVMGASPPTTNVVEAPPAPMPAPAPPPVVTPEPAPAGPGPEPAAPPATVFGPQMAGASSFQPPASPTVATLPAKKKARPLGVIILAVIVALAIAAVVVFAYLKGKDKPTTQTTAPATPVVTSTELTDASQDIDKNLNQVDDSKDVNSNDLSDQTLGL